MNEKNEGKRIDPIYMMNHVLSPSGRKLIEPIKIDFTHPKHASRQFGSHAFGSMQSYTVPPYDIMQAAKGMPYKYTDPVLLQYDRSDMGNCLRFLQYNGHIIRYCVSNNTWLLFNGKVWQEDTENQITRWVLDMIHIYMNTANAMPDEDPIKEEYVKHANNSTKRISSMLNLLKPYVSIQADALDQHSHLITVKNGILNLATGMLLPFDSTLLLTQYVDVNYSPIYNAPVYFNFLNRIFNGNVEMINYIQKVIGYCLTGETREQCFFILYGIGNNGKSTFLNIFARIFKMFVKTVPTRILLDGNSGTGSTSSELAASYKMRLLLASETNEDGSLNESKIKHLSGEEEISVRALFCNAFEYLPKFKILFNTNYIPSIKGVDEGIWRRIRLIKFDAQITDEEKRLAGNILDDMIQYEAEAILAWVLQGAMRYYAEGLQTPDFIKLDIQKFRDECDIVQLFMNQCVVHRPNCYIRSTDLYNAFLQFCRVNMLEELSHKVFSQHLSKKGITSERDSKGAYYNNIGLCY